MIRRPGRQVPAREGPGRTRKTSDPGAQQARDPDACERRKEQGKTDGKKHATAHNCDLCFRTTHGRRGLEDIRVAIDLYQLGRPDDLVTADIGRFDA